jgi:structural maintenance of chromosome 4
LSVLTQNIIFRSVSHPFFSCDLSLHQNARKVAIATNEDEEEILEKLSTQAEAVKGQIKEHRQRRRDIKDEARQLTKAIKSLEVCVPKLRLEIEGCDTTRQELTKLVPVLRSQSEVSDEDQAKVEELTAKVEECKSNMSTCVSLAERLESEVAKLQKEILDAGGSKLKKQKSKCQKILSQLNDAEKALNSSKVDITSAEKALAKAAKAKSDLTIQLEECEKLLEEKTAEFSSLEADALEVIKAYEEVKEIEDKKRAALESATKEAEELKKSQSDIKLVEIELLGQLDALGKQIVESQKKKSHWEKELEKLRDAELEDDDDVDQDEDEDMTGGAEDDEAVQSKQPAELKTKLTSDLSYDILEKFDVDEVKETIETLQNERNLLAKNANMGAIEEYRKKETDYLSRVCELDQVTEERNDARREHEELRRQRLEMFMEGFGAITLKLKEMYQMITLGGDAELELVDSLDPFSEGIVFSVRPPKKSWKNISNLSGGEKTLSSLSLVFALHHYKPTPLYVMDEIDAALDFKNVSIVANYIKERTKNAQFIIISLRNNMFELADRLVGIYKTNNCTKSVTINPNAFGVASQQNGRSALTPGRRQLTDQTNISTRTPGRATMGNQDGTSKNGSSQRVDMNETPIPMVH